MQSRCAHDHRAAHEAFLGLFLKWTRAEYLAAYVLSSRCMSKTDFLHVKPPCAHTLQLVGSAKHATCWHRVIEAEEVNGIRVARKPELKKKAKAKHA